jgi:hypothetical protein
MITSLTELKIPLADSAESAAKDAWDRKHAWHPFAQTIECEILPPSSIARGKQDTIESHCARFENRCAYNGK